MYKNAARNRCRHRIYARIINKNDPKKFTCEWFAWQNTLFGELILKLVNEGKVDLLNEIK